MKLQVEATTNGEEAIAAWEKYGPGYFQAAMFDHRKFDDPPIIRVRVQYRFDLSDMPICDGVEASKRIRALEVERGYDILLPSMSPVILSRNVHAHALRFKVIALTADCQESTKQLCLNAGMDAFLSKPANKTELFNLLQKLALPPPMDTDVPAEMRSSP